MVFEKFKHQALALLREAEGKGLLEPNHPIVRERNQPVAHWEKETFP
jgi:hypothetical protein